MEFLEKQKCLFVFKQVLDYFNKNFVVSEPVYDNTQPSKSIEKTIFKLFFHDYMLDLLPHTVNGIVYDFKSFDKKIFMTVIGRMWPQSQYKFVNELDYISTMKSVNFQVEPYTLSQKKLFNDILDDYIGYLLATKKKNKYVIDTRYLQQFEIREGYSKLDCIIYLDDTMHFDYCKINGQKRIDDLAIRECITAITTIVTLEKHAFKVHFLISDKFNILLNTVDKTSPIYRILIPVTNNPYQINESASITLLGQTGFCYWFNFTRNGLTQYHDYVKQNFKIRDFLIPKQFPGKSAINQHQHLWFNCIRKFVSKFLSIQHIYNYDDFINLLQENYDGIYEKSKTKLENIIDICSMMIYNNIAHECYSNPKISKLPQNPYKLSSSWKQNDSSNLSDKINNLREQTNVNIISYKTGLEAIRMDDERWINMCCVNSKEKQIYRKFLIDISQLDIPEDAILHPKNISSSVSY